MFNHTVSQLVILEVAMARIPYWDKIPNVYKYNPKLVNKSVSLASIHTVNIVCHFSQGHTMVTKNLDFIHKHPN